MKEFKFNSLSERDKLFVVRNILKGAMHSTIVPLILMMTININFSGNYGGVIATLYIIVMMYIYNKSTNRYFSKQGFYYGIKAICSLVTFLFVLVTSFKALIDLSRPTNKGATILGNTTISLNGSNGV